MIDYCAFRKDHKCVKWQDYELMRQELEEADETCHGNWIEIEKQYEYIRTLQSILEQHCISYPNEP